MKKALTAKTLDALKGKEKRYDVHDLHCPGLSVRVSENGRKVFSVKFRFGLAEAGHAWRLSAPIVGNGPREGNRFTPAGR